MSTSMIKKINWLALLVIIVYPIALTVLGISYYKNYGIGSLEIILLVSAYYISNITIGVGVHRYWSHNAFKLNKVVEFILILTSAATLQGPVLAWVSDHHKHHMYTDTPKDPHSPLKFQNRILGFLWSHIGWMVFSDGAKKHIERVTIVKLGKNKMLVWQMKYYWYIAGFMNLVVPLAIGYAIGGTTLSAYTAFLFIGLGRALQHEATFCINSLTHFFGTQKYQNGTAGDIWWMAPFLLGENWHNFHHAFPSDYRNGIKWYHFDVHKWIIFLLSKLGLAWDLDCTPEFRIEARVSETAISFIENRKKQLSLLQDKVDSLVLNFSNKFRELEASSVVVKNKLSKSFLQINASLSVIAKQLHSSIQLTENSSENFLKMAAIKLEDTEIAVRKLINEFDKLKTTVGF